MNNVSSIDKYDLGIIGAGVAGAFASLRIATTHPGSRTIIFDIGRPPGKRRRQIEGWLGCFPAGDGKIYPNNLDSIDVDGRKLKHAAKWVLDLMNQANPMKLIKDSNPNVSFQKKLKEFSYEYSLNDYYQWKPESIHQLSRIISESLEHKNNITFSFDNEVFKLSKRKGIFYIHSAKGDFACKKLIICAGRSGWRWVNKLYKDLGLQVNDDYAKFGIRLELPAQQVKELNKSHCTITKDNLELGPFSWNGSIIPEDHADLVVSNFRSNEDRWKSDKVSFSMTYKTYFKDKGCFEADRLAKLAFLLFNDRVSKEKIRLLVKENSQISLLPEYNWMKPTIENLTKELFPNLINKGSFWVPNIITMPGTIRLGNNLETELEDLFVAGESAGVKGILGAAVSGVIAADNACKG